MQLFPNQNLILGALWIVLGIFSVITQPGNYFYYGFFVIGAGFFFAHWKKDHPSEA